MIWTILAACSGALTIWAVAAVVMPSARSPRAQLRRRTVQIERRRLDREAPEVGTSRVSAAPGASRAPFRDRLPRPGLTRWHRRRVDALTRADLAVRPREFLGLQAGAALGGALILYALTGLAPVAVVTGLGLGAAAELWLVLLGDRRVRRFSAQLPAALQLLATSLQSGFGLQEAMRTVAEESEAPLAREFSQVLEETRAGGAFHERMAALADRVGTMDMRIVAEAIAVHQSVGGNLGEILHGIAAAIREREELRREVRALTAQERTSATIIALLPVWVVAFFLLTTPDLIAPLWEERLGQLISGLAVALEVVGFVLMRRVTQIRV